MSGTVQNYKDIIAELQFQGWVVDMTERGHYKAVPPDKSQTLVHFSTSDDPHAQLNILRDLKRRGFQWPPQSRNEQVGTARRSHDIASAELLHNPGICAVPDRGPLVPVMPASSPALVTEEQTMDRLFAELKEARSYFTLTAEIERDATAEMQKAVEACKAATREREMASEDMAKKKAAFDAAFTASAA